MISYTITPTSAAVTAAEVKTWLRIDHSTDDTLITGTIIPAAQAAIEHATGLSLSDEGEVVSIWDVDSNTGWLELPISPLQEIVKVLVSDEATTGYTEGGTPNYPTINITSGQKVQVEYLAGAETVDPELKLAVLMQAAYYYMNRENSDIAPAAKNIILKRGRNLAI
jgi:hypothetical protein